MIFASDFPRSMNTSNRGLRNRQGLQKILSFRSDEAAEESAVADSVEGAGGQQIPPCRSATRRNDKGN